MKNKFLKLLVIVVVLIILISFSCLNTCCANDSVKLIFKYADSIVSGKDISSENKTIKIVGKPKNNNFAILHLQFEGELDIDKSLISLSFNPSKEQFRSKTTRITMPITEKYFQEGINKVTVSFTHEDRVLYIKTFTFDISFENATLNPITSFGSTVSDWAKDDVEQANDYGLIPSTLKGKDLTEKINRSEFAAIAVLIYEDISDNSIYASSNPFYDVKTDPNVNSINKAYKAGIAVGTSSTTFEPNRNITREELATMLCRAIKKYKFPDWTIQTDYLYYLQGISGKKFADDNEISDFAKSSVYFMSSTGVIKGVDSTHFAPKASVTRKDAIDYGMATREQAIIMSLRIKKNLNLIDEY